MSDQTPAKAALRAYAEVSKGVRCPICEGIESCDHTVRERLLADFGSAENDRLRDELREAQRLADQLRENVGEAQNDLRDEVTKNDRLREALTRIAEVEEFRHGSGVFDYRPALDAATMQSIAFRALAASGGDRVEELQVVVPD